MNCRMSVSGYLSVAIFADSVMCPLRLQKVQSPTSAISVMIVMEEIDARLFGGLIGGGVEGEEELVEDRGEEEEESAGVMFRDWICAAFARGMTNWVTFSYSIASR